MLHVKQPNVASKRYWTECLGALAFVIYGCAPALAGGQTAQTYDFGRFTLMEENDKITSDYDRNYTQGMRLAYLSGDVSKDGFWDQPFGWIGDSLPVFSGADRKRKYEWTILGQSIFTPANTNLATPSSKDRPYAAWLYTGAALLQESKYQDYHTLENAELLLGVVGGAALGEVTQNNFHQFINVSSSLGWKNQLRTEPGFILSYERKWRLQHPIAHGLTIDVIPELGVSLGNVLTYGQAGGTVRFGQNLAADYGQDRIRPGPSGTAWFDADQLTQNLGWYVFAGAQGRAVGHSIFLDGSTYAPSASVEKRIFVGDLVVGASVFWSSSMRLDFSATQRTREFYGQHGHLDRFGGINLVIGL